MNISNGRGEMQGSTAGQLSTTNNTVNLVGSTELDATLRRGF